MMKSNRKKTTHRMRKMVSVFAIFTLLFSLAGCSKKTPREALEEAYQKTFTEENPITTLLGLTELNSKLAENKAHSTGCSLTLQELENEDLGEYAGILSGLGITVDTASDLMNRKSAATMDITYGGTTYLTLGGQLQGSKIHITSPQLLDGSLSVDFSTLKEDLASDSMLGQFFTMYGITLPDNLSANLLTTLVSPESLADMKDFISAYDNLNDAIIVEELEKKSVSLPSGVSAKKVYSVTIPEDAYTDVIKATVQSTVDYTDSLLDTMGQTDTITVDTTEFESDLEQITNAVGDIVFTVAVTKDGYISYVESEIVEEENKISLTAMFTGNKHPLTESEIDLTFEIEGKELAITYEESFDTKNNVVTFSADAKLDNETIFTFASEGEFTDMEKGKKYTLDFNYLELELVDFLSVSLSGSYYVDTTECKISTPSDPEYSLFIMSEDDFEDLAEEIIINIENDPRLSTLLELIESGY